MSLTEPVGVAMVGVGGHAQTHLAALRELQGQGLARLVAVCEAAPDRWAGLLDDLRGCGVAVEPDVSGMLARWGRHVSVVGAPVGIPAHRPVAVAALEAGCHVVLEKPPAGCLDDFDVMLEVQRRSGRTCAVHFQSIWLRSFQAVKAAILAGGIGRLREVRVKGRWFRPDAYYTRNGWAGRLRVGDTWVLDGTINNPFAHQIHNLLFLAGREQHSWANPVHVRAELYHARPGITGDDTSGLVIQSDTGVTLKSWLTLCSGRPERSVLIQAIGENGRITWPLEDGGAEVRRADGSVERIPADPTPGSQAVYANVCRYLLGRDRRLLCTLADTRPFTLAVSAAYEAAGPPEAVAGRFVERTGEGDKAGYVLEGVDEAIDGGFETGRMFRQMGVPWAVRGQERSINAAYGHFRPAWRAG